MGRPRKPTKELELSGAFEKHPERKRERADEPKPDGPIGPPPPHWLVDSGAFKFQEYGRLIAIWHELIAQAPPGVLTIADRTQLEIICGQVDQLRRGLLKPPAKKDLSEMLGTIACRPDKRAGFKVSAGAGVVPNAGNSDSTKANEFAEIAKEAEAFRPTRPN
jgi:hypothetical protein